VNYSRVAQKGLTLREEFKKMSAEEKLRGVGALLKVYQQEIDSLTKRCKGAEVTPSHELPISGKR
jgi:hypothetical protein